MKIDINRKQKQNKGFTLIELIIVMAIMAILASIIGLNVVRYIDMTRKQMDVQTAEHLYKATQLAMASANDDAFNGWSVCEYAGYPAQYRATEDGYPTSSSGAGTYNMRPVAWCRGIKYRNYENSYFKATLDYTPGPGDDGTVKPTDSPATKRAKQQRMFTNEMLHCFMQDNAKGGNYTGTDRTNYTFDGAEGLKNFGFKYKKPIKDINGGTREPECWIIYRRDDNGSPEIWIGYKQGSVRPICRVYPDPAEEYQ